MTTRTETHTMTTIARFEAEENTEIQVVRILDGRYSVGVFDIDSEHFLCSRIFPASMEAEAIAHARGLAQGSPTTPAQKRDRILDHVLDQVKAREREVTLDMEGFTREHIKAVEQAATERGFHCAFDGRFALIRDLR